MTSKDDLTDEQLRQKWRDGYKPMRYCALMSENFHGSCDIHPSSSKKDVFCLFCKLVVCYDCTILHHLTHPFVEVIDVRGHDAVWLDRMQEFMDCRQIQTFEVDTKDGKKKLMMIALKRKHVPTNEVKSTEECRKFVQEPFKFCSLSCKADHVVDTERDLSIICENEFLGLIRERSSSYKPLPPIAIAITDSPAAVKVDKNNPDRLNKYDDGANNNNNPQVIEITKMRGRTDDHEAHDREPVVNQVGRVGDDQSGDQNAANQNAVITSFRKRPRKQGKPTRSPLQ